MAAMCACELRDHLIGSPGCPGDTATASELGRGALNWKRPSERAQRDQVAGRPGGGGSRPWRRRSRGSAARQGARSARPPPDAFVGCVVPTASIAMTSASVSSSPPTTGEGRLLRDCWGEARITQRDHHLACTAWRRPGPQPGCARFQGQLRALCSSRRLCSSASSSSSATRAMTRGFSASGSGTARRGAPRARRRAHPQNNRSAVRSARRREATSGRSRIRRNSVVRLMPARWRAAWRLTILRILAASWCFVETRRTVPHQRGGGSPHFWKISGRRACRC